MGRKKKVGSIRYPNGRVMDVVPIGDTLKMQPRRGSLEEGEIIYTGHTKGGKLNHLNGYEKSQGKIHKIEKIIPTNGVDYRIITKTEGLIFLDPAKRIVGIEGYSIPPLIIHYPDGSVSGLSNISGLALFVGLADPRYGSVSNPPLI